MFRFIYQSVSTVYGYFYTPERKIFPHTMSGELYASVATKNKNYENAKKLIPELLQIAEDSPSDRGHIMETMNQTLSILPNVEHAIGTDLLKIFLAIPDIDVNYDHGKLLYYSVMYNHTNFVKLLMERKDIKLDYSALLIAIKNENKEIVKLLLQKNNIDLNQSFFRGDGLLISAIERSFSVKASQEAKEILEMLLKRSDVKVNVKDTNGTSALVLALNNYRQIFNKDFNYFKDLQDPQDLQNLQLLIGKEDVDINIRDRDGRTPLMIATIAGMTEVIKLLLQKENIDINAVDENKRTALMLSLLNKDTDSALLILEKKTRVQVNLTDNKGYTALYLAFDSKSHKITQSLLTFDELDFNLLPNFSRSSHSYPYLALLDGNFPFFIALSDSHPGIVSDFIHKANNNPHYNCGLPPSLIWASQQKICSSAYGTEVFKIILNLSKTSIDRADDEGNTPLIWAAMNKDLDTFQLLLEAGANPSLCNNNGETAAFILAQNDQVSKASKLPSMEIKEIETASSFTPENDETTDVVKTVVNKLRTSPRFYQNAETNAGNAETNAGNAETNSRSEKEPELESTFKSVFSLNY